MAKKIGYLLLMWFGIAFCYILLANVYPAFTSITASAEAATAATGNATAAYIKHPVAFMGMMPLLVWFIPGGLGVVASVVWLRVGRNEA